MLHDDPVFLFPLRRFQQLVRAYEFVATNISTLLNRHMNLLAIFYPQVLQPQTFAFKKCQCLWKINKNFIYVDHKSISWSCKKNHEHTVGTTIQGWKHKIVVKQEVSDVSERKINSWSVSKGRCDQTRVALNSQEFCTIFGHWHWLFLHPCLQGFLCCRI